MGDDCPFLRNVCTLLSCVLPSRRQDTSPETVCGACGVSLWRRRTMKVVHQWRSFLTRSLLYVEKPFQIETVLCIIPVRSPPEEVPRFPSVLAFLTSASLIKTLLSPVYWVEVNRFFFFFFGESVNDTTGEGERKSRRYVQFSYNHFSLSFYRWKETPLCRYRD